MSDDMGEIWREWNNFQKVRKAGNLDSFEQVFIETFTKLEGFRKCSPYHFQFLMNGLKVDYWPSSNRWYIKDLPGAQQSFNGTPTDLLNFVRKRIEKPKGPDLNAMSLEEFEDYAIETVKTFRKWWKLSQQANAENGGHTEEFPDTMNIAEWFEQYDLWSETEHEQAMRRPPAEQEHKLSGTSANLIIVDEIEASKDAENEGVEDDGKLPWED